jgi:predicted RNase H-like HicB family nuclease
MTLKYPAVMEQADFRGYGVWFPDFPGCVSQGDDPLGAIRAARETLRLHIQGMAEDGETIPTPTPAEAIELPADVASYVFLVDTEVPAHRVSYMRLNVTLPEGLVRRIDAVAGGNRSGWLAHAANEQLKRYANNTNFAASLLQSQRAKR